MPQQVKVSGKWRHTRARIRLSGTWKDIPQGYIKIGDIWKPIYSFFWETENWSSCSASCGGLEEADVNGVTVNTMKM